MITDGADTPKRSKVIASTVMWIILLCALMIIVGFLYLRRPVYLELPIEAPSSYLPRGDWLSTSYSKYETPGSQDLYYIWRRETYVETQESDSQSPFNNPQSIFEYFDAWLQNDNWEFYNIFYGDPCILYLPEAKVLPTGFEGYVAYRKLGAHSYGTSPTICLAVHLYSESDSDTRYHVVLMTINPSTLTVWKNQFELGWK